MFNIIAVVSVMVLTMQSVDGVLFEMSGDSDA